MSKGEKDLPSPSGEGIVEQMEDETITVMWTIDWGESGQPTSEADDLHYDRYGNIIKEDQQ